MRDVCCFAWSSSTLKSLDPFSAQKQSDFTHSLPAVTALAAYILDVGTNNTDHKQASDQFSALFHVCFVKYSTLQVSCC